MQVGSAVEAAVGSRSEYREEKRFPALEMCCRLHIWDTMRMPIAQFTVTEATDD